MKVEQIVLYLVQLPLLQSFETSFERISTKTAILAEVRAESFSGWENASRTETLSTALKTTRLPGTYWKII